MILANCQNMFKFRKFVDYTTCSSCQTDFITIRVLNKIKLYMLLTLYRLLLNIKMHSLFNGELSNIIFLHSVHRYIYYFVVILDVIILNKHVKQRQKSNVTSDFSIEYCG
jgi:hypothetical protein